ncbi:MAG: PAS domain S-box protein [Alphaproteobacteria bacterium]
MRAASLRPAPTGLALGDVDRVFPFHLAFDRDLRLVGVGSTLARICPSAKVGLALGDVFVVRRPEGITDFAGFLRNQRNLFLLVPVGTDLVLRGQVLWEESSETMLFLGSPWITDPTQIGQLGLSLSDFAIHDPIVDLVHLVQAQKAAYDDLKRMAATLTEQRAELRSANDNLAERNAALQAAQEQIRVQESEASKLALIASRTDNAVILTDAQARVEWVNEGFERISGYTLEEVKGQVPGRLLQGPNTDPTTVDYMRRRLAEGEGFNVEIVNYSKYGRRYWLAIEVQPIRDDGGEIVNYMAIETDITSRRESQEIAALFRKCAKVSWDPLYMIVPDDGYRFTYLNDAACSFLGYSLGRLIGMDVADVAPDFERSSFDRVFEDIRSDGRPRVFETRVLTADGRFVPIEISLNYVDQSGQGFIFGWFHDISDRKRLEAAVIEAAAHEQHRIGHDLHDGLGSYLGGVAFKAKALEQGLAKSDAGPLAEKASEIVKLLAGAMSQVRRLARGLDPVDVERFGLSKALEKLASDTIESYGIACTFASRPAEPAVDLAVARETYRIAQEAIHNAIRHGQAKNVDVRLEADAETVQLVVKDDGKGFRHAEPFATTNPRSSDSSGMGLRIMRYRAHTVGGEVYIDSEPGRGTEIRVECPVTSAAPEIARAGANPS